MTGDLIHPFNPCSYWRRADSAAFSCLTKYDIRTYFVKHFQKFVRFGRLVMAGEILTRDIKIAAETTKVGRTFKLKPDVIIDGEDRYIITMIRFVNPKSRQERNRPMDMPIIDIRLLIAYRAQLCKQFKKDDIIVLLLTNEIIPVEYLELLRDGGVWPVAITRRYLKACIRVVRTRRNKMQSRKRKKLPTGSIDA